MKSYKITPSLTRKLLSRLRAVTAASAVFVTYHQVKAADITKANNTDDLSAGSSWSGGVVPTVNDTALFDSSLDAGLTMNFSGTASWKGLKVVNNVGNLTVSTANNVPTITLGSDGMDLSLATSGTEIAFADASLTALLGKKQIWKIGDGVKATFNGKLTNPNTEILFDKVGTGTGDFVAEGFGTVSAYLPYTLVRTGTALNFATVDAARHLISADALGVANPSDGGVATTAAVVTSFPLNGYIDVTNSNGLATATAFQVQNASTFVGSDTGIRFNQPHTTAGTDWVVSFGGSNSRIQPSAAFSILVTPAVGARNVVFSNSNSGNEFRFNSTTTRLIFAQHNTSGNLIWRADITNAQGANANTTITKTGPGKLILANPNNTFQSTAAPFYINEGEVQLGESNATGSLVTSGGVGCPIVNNGTLRIQRSDTYAFPNTLSGTGNFIVTMGAAAGNLNISGTNTFTGPVTLESGTVSLNSAAALGVPSSITLSSGAIAYGTGITTDLSVSPVTLGGNITLNTGANSVTFANSIGGGGAGGITKTGTGVLTLAGANTYLGNTTVSAGGLSVTNTTGSATGAGNVTLSSGSTLSGTGTISGVVTANSGGKITPGSAGLGTLTVGGLTLSSGSLLDLEFTSLSSNDKIVVSNSNGLTVNGGGVLLYGTGTTTAWNTEGTYSLFQYNGTVQGTGATAMSVLNPQPGYSYTFASAGGFLTLNIVKDAIFSNWISTGSGSWASSSNWGNGVPSSNYIAEFRTSLGSPATVTLDGSRTVKGLAFDSSIGYTLAAGTGGSLILDKGASSAGVNVDHGNHVISAPVVLNSTMSAAVAASSSLTLSGAVSGAGGITKSGSGTLALSAANTFSGGINALAGRVEFSTATSLGSGSLTLSGATLGYATGNTSDISGKVITIGSDGATVDTNGNDVIWLNPVGNSGTGNLTKAGAGILALGGANTYSGSTSITGGTLAITANAALGTETAGSAVILDGGTLATSATLALSNAGANIRPVTIGAGGGTFNVADATTLTIDGVVSGSGAVTKNGTGTLAINGVNTYAGGTVINAGTVVVGGTASGSLGTGALTMNGATLNLGARNLSQALTVTGTNSLLSGDGGGLSGINVVSGAGRLNVAITGANVDLRGVMTGFTGTIAISSATGNFRLNGTGGSSAATFDLGTGTISVRNTATAIALGALTGSATSALNGSGGGATQAVTYTIGGANTDSTFAGTINNGVGLTSITKAGTGSLTLNGTLNYTGLTTVSGGTLVIDSVLPASAGTPVSPSTTPVTVNTGGTLSGTGTITPAVGVAADGVLRPDATGTRGGHLTVAGALSLAGTTQFDLKGTIFTSVSSTLASGVTYGGTLKLNFLGSIYNGSYTLFELTGSPAGAFSGVTVTTTATPAGASLTDSSGTWSGTVDGASFSFNASTGVLTVTGGATALTPGTPTGVTATAGNTQVSLGWSAAANADSYIVKRGTVAGGPYTTVSSSVVTTSYVDTGLTNGTTYYYVIQAKNASGLTSGNSAEVSATPNAVVLTGLQTWRQSHFGTTDNTGSAADSADPDGDGIPNLIEYATGRDPQAANSTPVLTIGSSGGSLTVTYTRIADPNLTYTVQGVNDLAGTPSWATVATSTGAANVAGSVTVTDTQTIASSSRRFLRLNVSYTP